MDGVFEGSEYAIEAVVDGLDALFDGGALFIGKGVDVEFEGFGQTIVVFGFGGGDFLGDGAHFTMEVLGDGVGLQEYEFFVSADSIDAEFDCCWAVGG